MKDEGVTAPVAKLAAALTGHKFIFAPVPRYLNFMQHNLGETKRALYEIFAVQPGRVVQTDYEPIPLNEKGKPCTGNLGMEVVDGFKFDKPRVKKVLELQRPVHQVAAMHYRSRAELQGRRPQESDPV